MPPLALSAPPKKRKSTKTPDIPVALIKTQKRKARAAHTAAKYAENGSSSNHNPTSKITSTVKATGILDIDSEDSHTERADARGDGALDEDPSSEDEDPPSDDKNASQLNTPEPRNDLAALLAMFPRAHKIADRNTNTVQTRIAWTKAKNCSSGNEDEVGEQMEDDKSPVVPVRRSLRCYATPSEEEPNKEEPDEEESAPHKGPIMNKAPFTVSSGAQFATDFTNFQVMTVAW